MTYPSQHKKGKKSRLSKNKPQQQTIKHTNKQKSRSQETQSPVAGNAVNM